MGAVTVPLPLPSTVETDDPADTGTITVDASLTGAAAGVAWTAQPTRTPPAAVAVICLMYVSMLGGLGRVEAVLNLTTAGIVASLVLARPNLRLRRSDVWFLAMLATGLCGAISTGLQPSNAIHSFQLLLGALAALALRSVYSPKGVLQAWIVGSCALLGLAVVLWGARYGATIKGQLMPTRLGVLDLHLHPNATGGLAAVVFAVVWSHRQLWPGSRWRRVVVAFTATCVILAEYRTGLLMVAVVLLVSTGARFWPTSTTRYVSPGRVLIGVAGLAGLAVVAVPLSSLLLDVALRPDFQSDFGQLSGRSTLWSDALVEIGREPWFGHGLGETSDYFDLANLHNVPLQILFDSGVLGLVVASGFLVQKMIEASRTVGWAVALPVLAALGVRGLSNFLFETPNYLSPLVHVLW